MSIRLDRPAFDTILSMDRRTVLEVCVDSWEAAQIASQAGADRLELCENLACDGITPSASLLQQVRSRIEIPIIVLIREREGDFVYSEVEKTSMIESAKRAVDAGAVGIAVGASTPERHLDWPFLERLADVIHSAAPDVELVVHRVFDQVPHARNSIVRLAELGFHRILTSGGGRRAIDSLDALSDWQHAFGSRIEFLPAGGIDRTNARTILSQSGCHQLHGSCRKRGLGAFRHLPDALEIAALRRELSEMQSLRSQPP